MARAQHNQEEINFRRRASKAGEGGAEGGRKQEEICSEEKEDTKPRGDSASLLVGKLSWSCQNFKMQYMSIIYF